MFIWTNVFVFLIGIYVFLIGIYFLKDGGHQQSLIIQFLDRCVECLWQGNSKGLTHRLVLDMGVKKPTLRKKTAWFCDYILEVRYSFVWPLHAVIGDSQCEIRISRSARIVLQLFKRNSNPRRIRTWQNLFPLTTNVILLLKWRITAVK